MILPHLWLIRSGVDIPEPQTMGCLDEGTCMLDIIVDDGSLRTPDSRLAGYALVGQKVIWACLPELMD